MTKAFGSRELIKCVECLGFIFKRQSSSHLIYQSPKGKKSSVINRNILPIQTGRKTYDKNARIRYISQIRSFSFSKKEIEECL